MAEKQNGQEKQDASSLRTHHDPGPWEWKRAYEIGHRTHWCLENPESAAQGRTIDASLVLFFSQDKWLGQPFLDNPNARLIAAAPETTETLRHLCAGLTEMIEEGRLQASDIPDDYFWLKNQLERADAILAKAVGKTD